MLKKDKKTVLVTGGNRGLGLAIVKSLSDAGYFVIAAARSCSSELTQFTGKAFGKTIQCSLAGSINRQSIKSRRSNN